MQTGTDISKTLQDDKKRLIIEAYLREKNKDHFDPAWLDNMANYAHLAAALDFFYKLNNEGLNLIAIGSDNVKTREDHIEQFKLLVKALDYVVTMTGDNPPVATAFKEKDAILVGLELNQKMESRSLRDLHAQSSNLGIAEKLLNGDLGQTEWLGEVDLERMLIKLGVKDRTHITRLNATDIGMILHFERSKHHGDTAPYTIPLLINCGSSGSLRSQGSHWTYAMVNVDPVANSIVINYQDSMPLNGTEQGILTNAINYVDGSYSAFPGYTTKTVNAASDGLQVDGWSCGYRALKGLLTSVGFPVNGGVNTTPQWINLAGTPTQSNALRDACYQLLLGDLIIDEEYLEAMNLDKEMLKESKGGYELDDKFTQHYLSFLSQSDASDHVVSTELFATEYTTIVKQLTGKVIDTERKDSLKRLNEGVADIKSNKSLSSDAKILALVELFSTEYALILKSLGGSNSGLGKFLKTFCADQFGVDLGKDKSYRLKPGGLAMRIINGQIAEKSQKAKVESLLPSARTTADEVTRISQSAPVMQKTTTIKPKISPSAALSSSEATELGQKKLRKNKELSRLGSMFGTQQFCYAEKPGGVEPGFRAIDLDAVFFKELDKILSDDHALSGSKLSQDQLTSFQTLRATLNKSDLKGKQKVFATFINTAVKGPHAKGTVDPAIQWLCNSVKGAVSNNGKLSAWMYKLDYAEGEKDRVKANKEAIREFVGTRLAGIFSAQNQKQEIAWVNNGKKGVHALLACGWKNGLQELRQFLHNGSEPDYNGVLVEDTHAPVLRSKLIPGLAKNLIFGVAIGDRDGMGKDAQNKGFAEGGFYGFDYGKPYEGEGVSATLQDDFSFEDKYAKAPAIFRGSSPIGIARHFMYRNYSVFYDTPLSERMVGVHLLKKMITGENPGEDVIKSYPGLRQELYRIQEMTPTPLQLLNQLGSIRSACKEGGPLQMFVDTYMMQVSTGKLSTFDCYFAKMKLDLIQEALINDMPYEELQQYINFIDEMAVTAAKSNKDIMNVFQHRVLLTQQEIDLIDNLEKIYSPTSALSHDGKVFLNTLRFDPLSERVPFQLSRKDNGTYLLTTTNASIAHQLKEDFGIDSVSDEKGLSCIIKQEHLPELMALAEKKYNDKREDLLTQPVFYQETFPAIISLLNKGNTSDKQKTDFGFLWRTDKSLSLRIIPKTEQQVQLINDFFGKLPALNEPEIIEIPAGKIQEFRKYVAAVYEKDRSLVQSKTKVSLAKPPQEASTISLEMAPINHNKWEALRKSCEDVPSVSTEQLLKQAIDDLVARYKLLIPGEQAATFSKLSDAIHEISCLDTLQKLMSYSDKTLLDPDNITAIIDEKTDAIKVIADSPVIIPSNDGDNNTIQHTV